MEALGLTARETELAIEAIENYLSDLRMEIANTDSQDFRDGLKERKSALRKLVQALRSGVPG
jgi:predicted RNA binding protein with dsRBD fold (UPF0201 family)